MEIEKLKDYYNRIDQCSLTLSKDADFDYIQSQIAKIAVYTEDMNRIIGELLVEKTKLEHNLTDIRFEYELKFTQHMMTNQDVKNLPTGKERKDYVNYFLLKEDHRKIINIELEIKDLESLLDFAKKKSRDLDRLFPKLQTLWESIQTEMKYIKKIGSDSLYIEKVRNNIAEEQKSSKPLFTDSTIEQIELEQYNSNTSKSIVAKFEDEEESEDIDDELDDLLSDL